MPDFSNTIDPSKFAVPDAAVDNQKADAIKGATAGISNDWTGVNRDVGQLAGLSSYFDQVSQGKGDTSAATRTNAGQQDLSGGPQTVADLGKAFLRLAKGGSAQSADVQQASEGQKLAAANEAANLRKKATDAQLGKMQSDMTLNNAQFAITEKLTQAQNGLNLATMQLKTMMNYALSNAKNSGAMADLQAQHAAMNNLLQYIQMGLGAGSSVAAGMAKMAGTSSPTSANGIPTGGLTGADADYANQQASQGYVGKGDSGAGPTGDLAAQSAPGDYDTGGEAGA